MYTLNKVENKTRTANLITKLKTNTDINNTKNINVKKLATFTFINSAMKKITKLFKNADIKAGYTQTTTPNRKKQQLSCQLCYLIFSVATGRPGFRCPAAPRHYC